MAPGVYTFHEAAAPTGYLAVTDITFQVNFDGTVTVLNANGNSVEYKNGKLVVTDQAEPTVPKEKEKPKPKKPLPSTGTEISFTLLALGLILIVAGMLSFRIRFKN